MIIVLVRTMFINTAKIHNTIFSYTYLNKIIPIFALSSKQTI